MAGLALQLAVQYMKDARFVQWMKLIGDEGQEQLLDLFKEATREDKTLAKLALVDPDSAMILFAYQMYLQSLGQLQARATLSNSMNGAIYPTPYPPATSYPEQPRYAKLGAKLSMLNGHCPEGYEVEMYLAGGCVKCRKGKALKAQEFKCGGKKRIKKAENGTVTSANKLNNKVVEHKRKTNTGSTDIHRSNGKDWSRAVVTAPKDSTFSAYKNGLYLYDDEARKAFHAMNPTKNFNGGALNVLNLYDFFKCGGKAKKKKKCEQGDKLPFDKCGGKSKKSK